MKNKKLILLLGLVFASGTALAQKQTVSLTTTVARGNDLTLLVNASAQGLKVDWGDGVAVAVSPAQGPSPLLKIEGTVQGESLRLYCDENLTFLDCEQCGLTELGLEEARDLHSLYCAHNALSVLNLRKMHRLVHLDCSHNELSRLIFSSYDRKRASEDLPLIEQLDLSHNKFSAAFNWHLPSLRHLNISGNRFTSAEIDAPSLQLLHCADNQLRGILQLRQSEQLQSLLAFNNQHTGLDVYHKGERMEQLFCDSCRLRSLDLEAADGLKDLSCSDNQLRKLVMPVGAQLSSLNVSGNGLDFSVLPTKRLAPAYLSFMPQQPFDFKEVEGVLLKEHIPYVPLSESWYQRHDIDLSSKGSLTGNHHDARYTWYRIGTDGSSHEMTQRKSSSGTGDFYLSRGLTAFFTPHKKAYVKMVSRAYGYTIESVPIAIGDDITGIENLTVDGGGLQMTVESSCLLFTGNGAVAIFTPAGKCIWKGSVEGREQVALPHGIYIVNKVKVVL